VPKQIKDRWVNAIYEMRGRGMGPKEIEDQIEATAVREQFDDYPSLTTIKRYTAKYDRLGARAQATYREFRWPQSMESGLLPWEASRLGVGLLERYQRHHGCRPTNGYVRWHWRLSLAWPPSDPLDQDADLDARDRMVAGFLIYEALGKPITSAAEEYIVRQLGKTTSDPDIPDYGSEEFFQPAARAADEHGATPLIVWPAGQPFAGNIVPPPHVRDHEIEIDDV